MEYYILKNNNKTGPYTMDDLKQQNIDADTILWRAGLNEWVKAGDIPELSDMLSNMPPPTPGINEMPKTWLLESILATVFCCLPLGIAAIVFAAQVSSAYDTGRYEKSLSNSRMAKKLTLWGVGVGAAAWVLYLGWFVLMTIGRSLLL